MIFIATNANASYLAVLCRFCTCDSYRLANFDWMLLIVIVMRKCAYASNPVDRVADTPLATCHFLNEINR